MLHSKTIETLVGLFIAIGLGALLVLSLKVSNLTDFAGSGDSYTVIVHFENIGGLKVRSPVKMAGVRIGQVEAIDFDSDSYEAVAYLAIDRKYDRIPTDTTASIYTSGLLGEQYVSLEPGGEEEYLQDGDRIELSQSAVVLEKVIGQFLYDKAAGGDK